MKPMLRIILLLTACAIAQAAAAAPVKPKAPSSPNAANILVRVNGTAIPQSRFDAALQAALAQKGADTPELRQAIKAQLIAREVFRQEAARRGLQNDPKVIEARDAAMIQRYLLEEIKPMPVSEEAVRARYEGIVAGLGEREFKARLIAVSDEALALDLLEQIKSGKADFAQLAARHSLLPSRERGGELDWVSFKTPAREGQTQSLPLPVAEALAALSPGMVVAQPLAWQGRHYLIRLDESRPTQIPPYDQVRDPLRRALEARELEKATAELVTRLLAKARIEP